MPNEDSELRLRKMLWQRHGCSGPALYGDDGELQCNSCMIDFRRNTPAEIEARFFYIGHLHAAKLLWPYTGDNL